MDPSLVARCLPVLRQNTMEKREKHLEKQVILAREQAKEKLKAKDKRGAIHLLKRSKLLETQINQIYGKKANIDIQIMALESAASNKEIFDVMKAGKDALKLATAHTSDDDRSGHESLGRSGGGRIGR
jgi:N-acetyl-gamma-glutamylphosphate reductase